MDDSPEVIRRQMEVTRASLTQKLEALEHTVRDAKQAVTDTIDDARQAVQESAAAGKGTVRASVDAVKHALDLEAQVQRHPWPMFGASVAVGFVGERLLERLTEAPAPQLRHAARDGEGRS